MQLDHPHYFLEENLQSVHESPLERRATFEELRSLIKISILRVDLCDTPKAFKNCDICWTRRSKCVNVVRV